VDSLKRVKTLQISVVAVAIVLLLRLFYIQVIDDSYKSNAANNVLRYTVQYPPRGEVYDRNGRFLVQSKEAYDLMAIPREIRPFDTAAMSRILGVSVEQIRKELRKASNFSRRRASVIFKQLPKEVKLRFEEHGFPGFFTVYRTVRSYPTKMAGNLLGYVGEVNDRILERNPYYRSGDYIGMSGIEQAYEEVLRGEKGVKIEMVDVHGIPKGSYANGIYDTLPSPGVAITCTIDGRLQAFAEELMQLFDLTELRDRHPHSLSGGQQQRLVIACAFAKKPDVIILDEPTSGLDGANLHRIAGALRQLSDEGKAVLVITHDLELVDMVCDSAIRLPLQKTNLSATFQ